MNPRKPNSIIQEDPMRTITLTPNSSAKSVSDSTETRDSFYFPGCRKDANCKCEICIASINATLDLIPPSHRSTLTRASRPAFPRSPVSFNPSSTPPQPRPKPRPIVGISPPLDSTARIGFQEKVRRRKRDLGYGVLVGKVLMVLGMVLGLEFGVSWMVSKWGLLSAESVKGLLGERVWEVEEVKGRFVVVKNGLEGLVGKRVSNCSSVDSLWKINQDGLLLNSRCVLYKSMTEEVSVWGWPLQASGLLTAEYSSRHLTIISGRVTEWSSGKAGYFVRKANSSWIQGKWSSSVVQFDPNTWILEYRRSFLMDNARLISAVVEFLKFRIRREFGKIKQEFWLSYAFGSQQFGFRETSNKIPT